MGEASETVGKVKARRRRGDLAGRIEERVDLMLEAITADQLKNAPVGQLASAIVTLTEKVRAIRAEEDPSPEILVEILERHVKDKASLRSIGRDLEATFGRRVRNHGGIGQWRPRNADGTFRGGGGVAGVGSE